MRERNGSFEYGGALRHYINEASKTPLLSLEEESDLSTKIQAGDLEAEQKMIKANLLLVVRIAYGYKDYGLDLEDLVSEGNIGLMRSVRSYKAEKAKFSTYAACWIKQSISRAIGNQSRMIRIPVHLGQAINKTKRMMSRMTVELGFTPSIIEVAQRLGLSKETVKDHLELSKECISLHSPLSQDDDSYGSVIDIIPDESATKPDENMLMVDDKSVVKQLLGGLKPRNRKIINMRFGFNGYERHTLENIGAQFGITRERIRQLEKEILEKLRKLLVKQSEIRSAKVRIK